MSHQEISAYLHSLANKEHAYHAMRYFKIAEGEYGHGDKFLGIRVPVIRQAVKKYQAATISTAEKLLHSENHEHVCLRCCCWWRTLSTRRSD